MVYGHFIFPFYHYQLQPAAASRAEYVVAFGATASLSRRGARAQRAPKVMTKVEFQVGSDENSQDISGRFFFVTTYI